MLNEPQSVLLPPRVFYTGVLIAAVLIGVDLWLLQRAHGNERQLEILAVTFLLGLVAVVYRYLSKKPQLKWLGAAGVWGFIVIELCAAGIFLAQDVNPPAGDRPPAPPKAATAPAAAGQPAEVTAEPNSASGEPDSPADPASAAEQTDDESRMPE